MQPAATGFNAPHDPANFWLQQEVGQSVERYCLWFAFYNFCRIHSTIRVTPAMEGWHYGLCLALERTAGLVVRLWRYRLCLDLIYFGFLLTNCPYPAQQKYERQDTDQVHAFVNHNVP
ncbi:MAG TPA: hypothetical protein VMR62_39290 [Bryobacteraceae bacterium]|nr:hypothetical protein [Bryobacteraceae bacterium]